MAVTLFSLKFREMKCFSVYLVGIYNLNKYFMENLAGNPFNERQRFKKNVKEKFFLK